MCFGGGGSSSPAPASNGPTATSLQNDANAQQAKIAAGEKNIDSAFGQFNEPYFTGYENTYDDYYNPQVDQQYKDAEGTLESGLARNGVSNSSVAASQIGKLFQNYTNQKATIANQGVDAANQLRTQVNNAKTNLYALNRSAADPAEASTQAQADATSLVAPQTFTPLGNLFASFVAPYTAYANAYNNSSGNASYVSPYSTPAVG